VRILELASLYGVRPGPALFSEFDLSPRVAAELLFEFLGGAPVACSRAASNLE
jgi:hypothetical protein